ncbi:hypothetical protein CJD36_009625 [Flavipsychrobacter stenotrophus]|uniref:Uncharacterized protein n=1 Tax=Flavipsychrobacter stenotrophus TaxID=2077091 RepID=A0A2S7SZJ2_9BACT|nr:hypothetical protein CJD36_009625 [Flavipsychrobacter stenotrophus]
MLVTGTCFAQQQLQPQLVILAPYKTMVGKGLEKQVADYNTLSIVQQPPADSSDNSFEATLPPYLLSAVKSEYAFLKQVDIFKTIAVMSRQYLQYRFAEQLPNAIFILNNTLSDGSVNSLSRLATGNRFPFVLNFPTAELYREKNIMYAKIAVKLYDSTTRALVINKTYIGDWQNHGFEFGCTDSSIQCTINNALSQILPDVIAELTVRSPELKRQQHLREDAIAVLNNEYLQKGYNKDPLKNIIAFGDENIDLNICYHSLYNYDKTKFVAFFLQQVHQGDLKDILKKDRQVNIQTEVENAFPDTIPGNYAYVVFGVSYKGKWYYEKRNVTYFDGVDIAAARLRFFSQLLALNFFTADATTFNPDFWETGLFKKVEDLTKEPEWNENKNTVWNTEERENRPYLGMYDVVATRLKKEQADSIQKMEHRITDRYLVPILNKAAKPVGKTAGQQFDLEKVSMVYPSDLSRILCFVHEAEGQKQSTMIVLLLKDGPGFRAYEWTYLSQDKYRIKNQSTDFLDLVNTLIDWNFAWPALNSDLFWNKYVLARDGNSYKYLKELK